MALCQPRILLLIATALIRGSHKRAASKLLGISSNWIINLDFKSNLLSKGRWTREIEFSFCFLPSSSTCIPYRTLNCIDLHLTALPITSKSLHLLVLSSSGWKSGGDFSSFWNENKFLLTLKPQTRRSEADRNSFSHKKHRRDWNQLQVFADKRKIEQSQRHDQCLNSALLMPRSKTLLLRAAFYVDLP